MTWIAATRWDAMSFDGAAQSEFPFLLCSHSSLADTATRRRQWGHSWLSRSRPNEPLSADGRSCASAHEVTAPPAKALNEAEVPGRRSAGRRTEPHISPPPDMATRRLGTEYMYILTNAIYLGLRRLLFPNRFPIPCLRTGRWGQGGSTAQTGGPQARGDLSTITGRSAQCHSRPLIRRLCENALATRTRSGAAGAGANRNSVLDVAGAFDLGMRLSLCAFDAHRLLFSEELVVGDKAVAGGTALWERVGVTGSAPRWECGPPVVRLGKRAANCVLCWTTLPAGVVSHRHVVATTITTERPHFSSTRTCFQLIPER